ncbi:hypothetical protein E2C01_009434 [Portunus trituberculatus]|uniref:Uncharacterized protein n=1 Tax=Portunus trituberculatus TaxID=210409 RepID=A0A5B7D531_PORTR|nr:hypothetical protein [Portunus trituberculatus]
MTSHTISLHIIKKEKRVDNSGKYPTMGGAASVACVVRVEGREGGKQISPEKREATLRIFFHRGGENV